MSTRTRTLEKLSRKGPRAAGSGGASSARTRTLEKLSRKGFAYRREDLENKIEEYVGEALLRFYVHRWSGASRSRCLAEARRRVERLLVVAMIHPIRGFSDRRRVATEVLGQLRMRTPIYRHAARRIATRASALTNAVGSTADDSAFWAIIDASIAGALE